MEHLQPRKKVLFHWDNQSVYDIWQNEYSRQPEIMALIGHFKQGALNAADLPDLIPA